MRCSPSPGSVRASWKRPSRPATPRNASGAPTPAAPNSTGSRRHGTTLGPPAPNSRSRKPRIRSTRRRSTACSIGSPDPRSRSRRSRTRFSPRPSATIDSSTSSPSAASRRSAAKTANSTPPRASGPSRSPNLKPSSRTSRPRSSDFVRPMPPSRRNEPGSTIPRTSSDCFVVPACWSSGSRSGMARWTFRSRCSGSNSPSGDRTTRIPRSPAGSRSTISSSGPTRTSPRRSRRC